MSDTYRSKLRSSTNKINEPIKQNESIKPTNNKKGTFKDVITKLKIDEKYTKPHKKYKFDTVKANTFPMQDYNFMVDLIQMPETSKKFKHLLVVVDIWSNEFDAEPLITKTAAETLSAFKTIIKRPYLNMPKASIRSDNGTEFLKEFTAYLK